MSDVILVVVHGCPRIHHKKIDEKIRQQLGPDKPIIVSFPECVALHPDAVLLTVSASFYPDQTVAARYEALGAVVTKIVKCPVTTLVENRHETAQYQQVSAVIDHRHKTGKRH
jgi:hypothetical protein